jgi:hypothetical protein
LLDQYDQSEAALRRVEERLTQEVESSRDPFVPEAVKLLDVRVHDIAHTKGPRQRGLNNWAKGPRQRGLIRGKPDRYWLFLHSSWPLNVVG